MMPISPPPTRAYRYAYQVWRQSRDRAESEVRHHNRSGDGQVLKQPAPVSNQPSTSSDWSNKRQLSSNSRNLIQEDNGFDKTPVLNIIPEFDPFIKGQTIDSWIKKVELCREIGDWSEAHTTYYAIKRLSGQAKTWYQALPSVIVSWEELKKKLLEAFPETLNYAVLLTEMLNLKAGIGDCLVLYYHEKMNMLLRCNIFGKKAVDCLVHGVEDKVIRIAAEAAQFTEPYLLLNFFKGTLYLARPELTG